MKIIVLTSDSVHNITEATKKGYWEHGRSPSNIQSGDRIYIKPKKSLIDENTMVLTAIISNSHKNEKGESDIWKENKKENYSIRIFLDKIKLVPSYYIPEEIIESVASQNGIKYL